MFLAIVRSLFGQDTCLMGRRPSRIVHTKKLMNHMAFHGVLFILLVLLKKSFRHDSFKRLRSYMWFFDIPPVAFLSIALQCGCHAMSQESSQSHSPVRLVVCR